MKRPRYDWEQIRDEYVAGSDEVTLESVAKKHDVSFMTTRLRSMREKWAEQRKQFRNMAQTKTLEKASTTEAEIRVRQMGISKYLSTRAINRFQSIPEEEITPQIALRMAVDGMKSERDAAGIADPTEIKIPVIEFVYRHVAKKGDDADD